MQRTKTTILFPDAGDPNIPSIRKGSVTITGSIHNVYFARQMLLVMKCETVVYKCPPWQKIFLSKIISRRFKKTFSVSSAAFR